MTGESLSGQCVVLFAYEIGRDVDLPRCRTALQETQRLPEPRGRPAPSLFGLSQLPLVWRDADAAIDFAGRSVTLRRRAVLYDFGCVSVALEFQLEGSLLDWRSASCDVALDRRRLGEVARASLNALVEVVRPYVREFGIHGREQPYTVYQVDAVPGGDTHQWLEANALEVAQILRSERVPLSRDEVAESTSKRLSYTTADLVVIDWAAAWIIDSEFADTLAVLEFANIELLSMHGLDEDLDDALDQANLLIRSPQYRWSSFFRPYGRPVRKLVELTADAAAEFEAVENAIKLTEDHYLGRVYRMAAERFHLTAFDVDITRKLQTLWNIHNVFLDRASNRRSELLEWIIIALISVELLQLVH
jgi:hypothetical protein